MEQASRDNSRKVLSFTIRNSFWNIYVMHVFAQFMRPFIWFNTGLILILGYQAAAPFLQMREPFLAVAAAAMTLVWVEGITLVLAFLYTLFLFLTNKLRGVIGEHELNFEDDGLVEKTAFNEQKIKYESMVHFFETFGSFLLVKSNMGTFMIPKKQITAEIERALRERMAPWKKAKAFITPYIVTPFFLAAVVIIGITVAHAQYLIMTSPWPVLTAWDKHQLYVYSGKTQMGQQIRYRDVIGFGLFSATQEMPPELKEQYLWRMQGGVTTRFAVKNLDISALCLVDGRLLAVSFGSRMQQEQKVYVWDSSNAFQTDPRRSAEAVLKECRTNGYREVDEEDEESMRAAAKPGIRIVGAGKPLVVPLDGFSYELSIERGEAAHVASSTLFGGVTRAMLTTLSGRWIGSGQGSEDLLSIRSGTEQVSKEVFFSLFPGTGK